MRLLFLLLFDDGVLGPHIVDMRVHILEKCVVERDEIDMYGAHPECVDDSVSMIGVFGVDQADLIVRRLKLVQAGVEHDRLVSI